MRSKNRSESKNKNDKPDLHILEQNDEIFLKSNSISAKCLQIGIRSNKIQRNQKISLSKSVIQNEQQMIQM